METFISNVNVSSIELDKVNIYTMYELYILTVNPTDNLMVIFKNKQQ